MIRNEKGITATEAGSLPVSTEENGHICEDNSTTEILAIDGVFEGVWQDTLNYNVIIIGSYERGMVEQEL